LHLLTSFDREEIGVILLKIILDSVGEAALHDVYVSLNQPLSSISLPCVLDLQGCLVLFEEVVVLQHL
jgi:hypothetical protein